MWRRVVGACNDYATLVGLKERRIERKSLNVRMPEAGIEPTTFALRIRCSTN